MSLLVIAICAYLIASTVAVILMVALGRAVHHADELEARHRTGALVLPFDRGAIACSGSSVPRPGCRRHAFQTMGVSRPWLGESACDRSSESQSSVVTQLSPMSKEPVFYP